MNLRSKFTKWYYRKGYRMEYRFHDYEHGDVSLIFHCPWYVRPLVNILFSPSAYYNEFGRELSEYFIAGMESVNERIRLENPKETP